MQVKKKVKVCKNNSRGVIYGKIALSSKDLKKYIGKIANVTVTIN